MNPEKATQQAKEKTEVNVRQLNDEYQTGKKAKELTSNDYWKRLKNLWQGEINLFNEMKKNTPIAIFSQTKAEEIRDENGKTIGWMKGEDVLRSMQLQEIVAKKLEEIIAIVENDINAGDEAEKSLIEYKNKLKQ